MTYPFEPFRLPNNKIDFQGFMAGLMTRESFNSYYNAFSISIMENKSSKNCVPGL